MMLFMPLGFAIDKKMSAGWSAGRATRRWLRFSACFTVITIGVLSLHMVTGFWQSYGPKWVVKEFHGDNVDPTIQGIDYNDIMTRFQKEGWLQNKKIFAGSPRWWLIGKVDWALKGQKEVVCFSNDPRNMAFLVDPKTLLGHDAIIIAQENQASVDDDVKPFFDAVKQLPDIEIIRNGRVELRFAGLLLHQISSISPAAQRYAPVSPVKWLPPFGK